MEFPELSYDGKGVNGPDEHRARIATFTSAEAAKKYGPLFASAPELIRAVAPVVNEEENKLVEDTVHKCVTVTLTLEEYNALKLAFTIYQAFLQK